MTTIVLVGAASFLLVLAILAKAFAGKPRKKPEKWEKAQIVKRLLALSEQENMANGISRQKPVLQNPTPKRRAAAASASASRTARPAQH